MTICFCFIIQLFQAGFYILMIIVSSTENITLWIRRYNNTFTLFNETTKNIKSRSIIHVIEITTVVTEHSIFKETFDA